MGENDEYIDIDFPRSPPFWSLYRDRINGRNYVQHGEQKSLKKITLVRHDPEQPTDSNLSSETNYPYADPFGHYWNGVLDEFEASSGSHDSKKAISAYSLSIDYGASYHHFVMSKDTLSALASAKLQLTLDDASDGGTVKKITRKRGRPSAVLGKVMRNRPVD